MSRISHICFHEKPVGKGLGLGNQMMSSNEKDPLNANTLADSRLGGPVPSDAIASRLRQYYKSVEQEPIPDQLLDLLEQLDQAERSGSSKGDH